MPMMPESQPDQQQDGNVSPQEQEQYDKVVTSAMKMIHGMEMRDQVIQMLQSGGDPGKVIGELAAQMLLQIKSTAAGAGEMLSPDVVFNAGAEIIEELTDLALNMRLIQEGDVDRVHEVALKAGIDFYKSNGGGDQAAPQQSPQPASQGAAPSPSQAQGVQGPQVGLLRQSMQAGGR